MNQDFPVMGLDWFKIHFTENEGMAFGLTLSGSYGKLALSVFRILAVIVMGYYLNKLVKLKASKGLIISLSLIFAGALGNIIDSAFYGLLFSSSYHGVATFLPEGGGYASFLHGHVVDMFYFPMWSGKFPTWFPFWGGEHFLFFRSIFNVADMAITFGVILIIFFQKSFFEAEEEAQLQELGNTDGLSEEQTTLQEVK